MDIGKQIYIRQICNQANTLITELLYGHACGQIHELLSCKRTSQVVSTWIESNVLYVDI